MLRDARIGDRVTDRKMVDDLPLVGYQVEMTVHLIIVEGTDAGCPQSKRFSSEIKCLANSACLKMDIAITTVAIGTSGTIEIADHRKGHAGITGEVLTEAQTSRRHSLVATLDLLQPGTLRQVPVDAGL